MLINLIHILRKFFNFSPDTYFAVEDFLIYKYYIFLSLLFILCSVFLVLCCRYLCIFERVSYRGWLYLFLIFNASVILRFFITSHHPQVFFDEVTFIETAENYYRYGLNMQNSFGPHRNIFLICPTGWPFLISLVFHITGVEIKSAFSLSALLSSFTTLLVFGVCFLFFESEKAALWSSLLFSVHPLFIRLSGSSAMGTSSVFFILLAMMFFLIYFKYKKAELLILSFLLLAFTVNIRQEAFLTIMPLLLLFFFLFNPDVKREFKNVYFYVAVLLLAVFSFPAVLASLYGVGTGFYFFYEPPEMIKLI